MPTKIEITCFTDLEGSTATTERLGHQEYMKLLAEHLQLGKVLAERNGGNYVKNVGDAHMVRFEYIESALGFALQMQEMCSSHPGFVAARIPVRVSLFQGAVEPSDNDVFGSGVNQAARLQGFTEPSTVTVNADMFAAMRKAFGPDVATTLCTSLGEHELKGITDPPKQELFLFEYVRYRQRYPTAGIAYAAYEQLKGASVEPFNVTENDLAMPGTIVWPVVPRELANVIHRGQIEVIRLLTMVGWKVKVLLADCGGDTEYTGEYVTRFIDAITKHAASRGVTFEAIEQMSRLYDPGYAAYRRVQEVFRGITARMSVQVLMKLNEKKYSEADKAKINEKATLTYLRPPLTIAAVLHLTDGCGSKCVVVSGADETEQWNQALVAPGGRTAIGVLMIPVIKVDPEHQMLQQGNGPIWYSEQQAVRECTREGSNVASWFYRLLAFLPAFPTKGVDFAGVVDSELADEEKAVDEKTAANLVQHVWPILHPV